MKKILKSLSRKSKKGGGKADPGPSGTDDLGIILTLYGPNLIGADKQDPKIALALSQLGAAVDKFEKHYGNYAKKNKLHMVQNLNEVQAALTKAKGEKDFKLSAQIFENEITHVLQVNAKKQELSQSKRTGKVCNFLVKLYPIAKLSLGLTESAAEVCIDRLE
jgi:hypothetical protein